MRRNLLIIVALLSIPSARAALAQGTPIGFEEDFALASDREAALEQLIPGTEDYYYYWCLHRQNTGALDKVEPLLELWVQRYGHTPREREIENRQALLRYDRNPKQALEFLHRRLRLRFNHQREVPGRKPDLPTRLSQERIGRAALTRRALKMHPRTVGGFEPSAFDFLAARDLGLDRLHSLLERLVRPDIPNLPALVVRDLDHKASRGFGSLTIHKNLLLDQLEECVQLRPSLLNESAFVNIYLRRLLPPPDTDWRHDPAAREAFLDRLEGFARRLAPVHNSLKAHVLYRRLAHDRALGRLDRDRFLAYLRLPRQAPWVNPRFLEKRRRPDSLVNLAQDYPTGLDPIRDDEPLVRAYLMELFRTEDSWEPYSEYVRDDYLKRLFAETRILYGLGDMERWYSLLDDPGYYERLKERVELAFAPTQKEYFRAEEPVSIDIDVKNVHTLLVKVFEINTFNFYREQGKEIDASINLDGLVPTEETTTTYDEPSLRRHREHFEFPSLGRRGVFIVEFIGNGISSRAVLRKGRLRYLERTGAAGHVFRVLDEANRPVPRASLWLSGHEYGADEEGDILVPYSTKPARQTILLRDGDFTTLERFDHQAESYELRAGIFVDRESLLRRRTARILVRPSLLVNGEPASLDLLEDPALVIKSRDHEGIESSRVVRPFELHADRESVQEIRVPDRLALLTVTLQGHVRSLSRDKQVELASRPAEFTLSGIETKAWTDVLLLGRDDQGWLLDALGKNGEPRPDRAVHLRLKHRDFTDPLDVTLKTDEKGRIRLGPLEGITRVTPIGEPYAEDSWAIAPPPHELPREIHARAGDTVRVPYDGTTVQALREAVAFLERRAGTYLRDRLDLVSMEPGFVALRSLPAGDYELWFKETGKRIPVRVAPGEVRDGWVLGEQRLLERPQGDEGGGNPPLQITGIESAGGEIVVRLAGVSEETRVHVVATRYAPPFHPFRRLLAPPGLPARTVMITKGDSTYHSGRDIGEEYRYILDRRLARKFPGNMLARPGLLLNPWALEETRTAIGGGGAAGRAFAGKGRGGASRRGGGPAPAAPQPASRHPGLWANLDFLPAPSVLLANLRPDAGGVVRVAIKELGPGRQVHVVAVDSQATAYRSIALPSTPLEPADLRLRDGLDPSGHFTEQRRIDLLREGQEATIDDITTSKVEPYDSLAKVFRLFSTLSGNGELAKFHFVLDWPGLAPEKKRELYSKHACHELHFFLYRKDPEFFREVVRPYLADKMDKTFLDHWLLGDDLAGYLEPWAYGRLNIVERILLAQRIEGEGDATARHVGDLLDLIPPDPDRAARLFRTALAGSALEAEGKLRRALRNAAEKLKGGETEDLGYLQFPEDVIEDQMEEVDKEAAEAPAPPREGAAAGAPRGRAAGKADWLLGAARKRAERAKDLKRRSDARRLYVAPDRTRQYVESNYWHRRIEEQDARLIRVNAFWRDYAEARGREPFYSTHIAEAAGRFAEMMLALGVLDLPFESSDLDTSFEGARMTLRARGPLVLYRREIKKAAPADRSKSLLVSQNFFRLDDRWRHEGNQRFDKYVTGEFLTGVVYGCQVVLTNPTSSPRKLELLAQIPRGSLPVKGGFYTRGVPVELGAYATTTFEYQFYFPEPGRFAHFPVHVASDGTLLAFAEPVTMTVLREPSSVDTTSWAHVSQNGTPEEVLAYLDAHNLGRLDLSKIAWRMRDRGFFDQVLERLRGRHVFDPTLWAYGVYHNALPAIREYLRHADGFLRRCGRYIDCTLVTIDPVERRTWQHIEYEPLFNPRAHRFGKRREILNGSLAAQYRALMEILGYRPRLDDGDWMSVTYYLLLQDRVEEALEAFSKVHPDRLGRGAPSMRLQYDYMRCYLDFFTDDHAAARGIAERYLDHPVTRWRERFREVVNQLDEAEGRKASRAGEPGGGEGGGRERRQTALAATEPSLDLGVEARKVTLRYRNLRECEVAYYEMDIEFLFSTNPFVKQGGGSFAYIRPNRRDMVRLPGDRNELVFDLPEEFRNANVLVEVRGGGIARRQAYYANALAVQVIETYGQLRVTHAESGKPIPKVYVKVYARMAGSGRVRFHKDGYTDLRGRFDYASLSGEGIGPVERYAILVLSEHDGAVIREAAPPKE